MVDSDSQRKRDSLGRLVTSYNRFGFKLLATLFKIEGERNLFISQFGVALSLALIYNGAGGSTRQAIAEVLESHEDNPEEINRNTRKLYQALVKPKHKTQLAMACALWADKNISFDPSFLEIAQHFFKAEARSISFDSADTVDTINNWVQQRTNGKISSLVERDDFQSQTDCILTNAVYFKGLWTAPFEKEATREGIFHLQDEQQKSVQLMRQLNDYAYLKRDDFEAVSLPYGDGEISSYIFLPAPRISLSEFLKSMKLEMWEEAMQELQERQVELILPRFKISYQAELRAPLDRLGMGIAFNDGADLSPLGLAGHYITGVEHKAVAEINEEGTEAAAATAMMMGRSLFTPPRMIVDRPFFWAIRHHKTGLLLFTGAVFDPGDEI